MRHIVASVILSGLFAVSALASTQRIQSLKEKEANFDVSRVASSTVLGENKEKDIKVRLVALDLGLSTDVSPRYALYLTFFHASDSMNSRTAFYLGEVFDVVSTSRKSAGIYQISARVPSEETTIKAATLTVDTNEVWADDARLGFEEFSDPYFTSEITLKTE
jgi:hypothetical protein